MIKEKQLFDRMHVRGLRYACNQGETEEKVRDFTLTMLRECNERAYDLPLSINEDTVAAGGFLNNTTYPSIVIANTSKNYFKYVLMVMPKQGKNCHIRILQMGTSETWGKNPNTLAAKLTGLKTEMQNEATYYAELEQMISDALRA